MTRYLTSIILLASLSFTAIQAQNIKRGYKLLEKNDYQKAKEIFQKAIADNNKDGGAYFGMAVIYSNKQSPDYNLIKAWEYCLKTEKYINSISPDDQEVLTEYFINTEERRSSRPVKKKMNMAIEAIESDMIKYIREENNIELAEQIIESFPGFRYYDNVVHIRNHLKYRAADKINTIEAYNHFIAEFPDAAQVPKAIENRNTLAFIDAKTANTTAALELFIQQYPDASEVSQATLLRNKLAYNQAKKVNTIAALEAYMQKYPDALEIADAKLLIKKLVYEKAKKIRSLEAYNQFIKKYPEGEYFIDIFNLKATDLGRKYLQSKPPLALYTSWAQVFDNGQRNDITGAVAKTNNNNIVLACNTQQTDTSNYTDVWVLMLNNNGEMLWNKQIGGVLGDHVNDIAINSANEIYIAGYNNFINDTLGGQAWVFKLGADGKRLWQKEMKGLYINAMHCNTADQLILTGTLFTPDSVYKHYITKLNPDGKKLWQRTYSGNYFGNDIDLSANDLLLVTTSNWVYTLDQRGYIGWETIPDTTVLFQKGAFNNQNNEAFVAGVRDSTVIFIRKYNSNGDIAYTKNVIENHLPRVYDLEIVNGKILLAVNNIDNDNLLVINNEGVVEQGFNVYNNRASGDIYIRNTGDEIFVCLSENDVVLLSMPINAF